jgi:hypothetical protein
LRAFVVFDRDKPSSRSRQYGYTSASARFILIALPGGGINVPFTSVGDIDAWKWKRVGLRMDDTSGKFALVVLRAKHSACSSQANEARIRVSYFR